MFDNGLIKYYQTGYSADGVLNLKRFSRCQHLFKDGVLKLFITPNCQYFSKTGTKEELDAEILLSQVYARAGFDTTFYTPAIDTKDNQVVLSNSVASKGMVAQEFFNKVKSENRGGFPWGFSYGSSVFSTLPDFMTKQGARDVLKMTLFDVASANFDRSKGNYIIKTSPEGKADGVVLYDYGASGVSSIALSTKSAPFYESEITYQNLFNDYEGLTRNQIVREFKTNESALSFISPVELAESLGSVNPVEIARDIKSEIGYQVEPEYADFIASNYNNFAEQLVQK